MEYTVYTGSEGSSVEVCVLLSSLPAGGLQWEIVVTLEVQDGLKAGILFTFGTLMSHCYCGTIAFVMLQTSNNIV